MAGVPGQGRAPLTLCSYASTATPHSPSCWHFFSHRGMSSWLLMN
jgi:hypothetical protein